MGMRAKLTNDPATAYWFVAMAYGTIITAGIFSELNFAERKIEFLMLPSSIFEKYFAKFIFTSICFFIIALGAYIFSAITVEVWNPEFRDGRLFERLFPLLTFSHIAEFLRKYIIFHSIFIFGAVYFRKLEFGKTISAYLGFVIFIVLYTSFISQIPFFSHIYNWFENPFIASNQTRFPDLTPESSLAVVQYRRFTYSILLLTIRYIVPLFFWSLAYLRLKESEVRDGV
jgi:hypothetical protein